MQKSQLYLNNYIMKILSLILGITAILNLIAIMLCAFNVLIPKKFLIFGMSYCIIHIFYQLIMGEGPLSKIIK
jgi:hypothetical protein